MRTIPVEQLSKIKKAVPKIENKLKIHFTFGKNSVTIKGNELAEYLTDKIVRAIDFGFDVEDTLLLAQENFILEFIPLKEHTRRKNLHDVRARVIGTDGKAKRTIEKLTGAILTIHENTIGVIVDSEHVDAVTQALESLIGGAKHGNVFSYLEKQNMTKNNYDEEDLGLKEGIEKD